MALLRPEKTAGLAGTLSLRFSKAITLRLGVKNLLDRQSPPSLRASSGHQVGYDPRYAACAAEGLRADIPFAIVRVLLLQRTVEIQQRVHTAKKDELTR
jgi:hypothetical protein